MGFFSGQRVFQGIDEAIRKKVEAKIDDFIKKLETQLGNARKTENYDWFIFVMKKQLAFLNPKNTKKWIYHISLLDKDYLERIKNTAKHLLELYLLKERPIIEPTEIALSLIYIVEATNEGVFPGWFIRYESDVSDASLKKTKDTIIAKLETYKQPQDHSENYNLTKTNDRKLLAKWIKYLVENKAELLTMPQTEHRD